MNSCLSACLSCLGLNRSRDTDDSETRGLLHDDPYRSGARYSTMGGARGAHSLQRGGLGESEDSRRKREQIEGIVGAMSDNIVDFPTIKQPQPQQQMQAQVSGASGGDASSQQKSPLVNGDDRTPKDLSLKTIKRGRGGPIFTRDDQGVFGLKAVQDAIG